MKRTGSPSPKYPMFVPGVGEHACLYQVELYLFPALKARSQCFSETKMFASPNATDKTPPDVIQDELFGAQPYTIIQAFPNPLHLHLQH